ncbi:MAG: hypothetical protein HYZ53_07970 [Planctomycetes bacterium]|nr:hypothetical protein [Planctomycetota bacterium]
MPAIEPLEQAGQGRAAALELPPSACRKADLAAAKTVEREKVPRVLSVQAERTSDGGLRLGCVGREWIGVTEADELEGIRSPAER